MFRKPYKDVQDKPGKDSSTAIVYKINCKNSEKVYIGRTNCALETRTKEHKRAIFLEDNNSLLAQHQTQTKYVFDLGGVYMEEGQPSLPRSRISVKFFVKICCRLYEKRASPPWQDLAIDYRDLA